MVDLTYQMALNTLQTTGLLLGTLYYVMDLRNQREDQRLALWNQEQTLKTRKITLYQQTV